MTEVKDQRNCGSCWAFSATSALEGTIGVLNKEVSARLSEQQLVDCTRSTEENEERFGTNYGMGGCRGGWFTAPWRFMRDQGAMTNEDYPYMAKHQTCAHDESKIAVKTKDWGTVYSVKKMKDKLTQQPGAVALAAGSK